MMDFTWTRWIVRKVSQGLIAPERMHYLNNILDAHHSRTCHITFSVYPYDQYWAS